MFTAVDINTFKRACNSVLNKLKIIMTNPPTKINNETEKKRLMTKYHDDQRTNEIDTVATVSF